jgi:hypothetical protein
MAKEEVVKLMDNWRARGVLRKKLARNRARKMSYGTSLSILQIVTNARFN